MNHQVLLIIGLITATSALTFEDLKAKNGKFYEKASCNDPDPTCHCDAACNEYDDCCLDAKAYDPTRMDDKTIKHSCRKASLPLTYQQTTVYMKEECVQGWTGELELGKCSQPNGRITDPFMIGSTEMSGIITVGDDPEFDLPVTSSATNHTYRNSYCAVCNNESPEAIQTWAVEITCNFHDVSGVDENYVRTNMKYVNETWAMNTNDISESWRSCRMKAVVPDKLNQLVRRCIYNVAECSSSWKDKNDEKLCQSYTAYVGTAWETYKNYHCAICQGTQWIEQSLDYRSIGNSTVSEFQEKDCQFEYESCIASRNCSKSVQCRENSRCRCDNQCIEYGDCCLEAETYDLNKMVETVDKYTCGINMGTYFSNYYIRSKCPEDWPDDSVNELCLDSSKATFIPVTSTATNITYKNLNCGLCNNESQEDLQSWLVRVNCELDPTLNIKDNLQLVEQSWEGFINKTLTTVDHPCGFETIAGFNLQPRIRSCTKYISTCSPNWSSDSHVERLCNSYMRIVSVNSTNYRNYHCAICNFVKNDEIKCFYDGGFGGAAFAGQAGVSLSNLVNTQNENPSSERKKLNPLGKFNKQN